MEFVLANSGGNPLAGYTGTNATLNFTSIPEPVTTGLAGLSLAICVTRRRRQSKFNLKTSAQS